MQYGTIRKYSIKTIIEWKLSSSSSLNIDPKQQNQQIRSTIVMKCLNRLQWNNDHSKQQQQQRQITMIFETIVTYTDDFKINDTDNEKNHHKSTKSFADCML